MKDWRGPQGALQIPPLRYAPVGMTREEEWLRLEWLVDEGTTGLFPLADCTWTSLPHLALRDMGHPHFIWSERLGPNAAVGLAQSSYHADSGSRPLQSLRAFRDRWTHGPGAHPASLVTALNQLVLGGSGSSRDLQRQSDAPHLRE